MRESGAESRLMPYDLGASWVYATNPNLLITGDPYAGVPTARGILSFSMRGATAGFLEDTGQEYFLDPIATNLPRRYYRAKEKP
jgi:hypothetical protein